MEIHECPQCGAAAEPSNRKCSYCKVEFFVTSLAYLGNFDSGGISKYLKHYKELTQRHSMDSEGFLGLGLCYLKMANFQLASKCFEQVINISPEISQAYYYFALANIRRRRLMTLSLNEIRQLETYLNTAIQLNYDVPQYKLLLSMIKRDYYEINGMRFSEPSADKLLSDLRGLIINESELNYLRSVVIVGNENQYYTAIKCV